MYLFYRLIIGPPLFVGIYSLGLARCLLRPFDAQNVYWTAKKLGTFAEKILGIKFHISGEDRFPPGPKVIISNHQNNYDMFPGGKSVPPRTVTLGKMTLLLIPVFGLFYWLSGNILINRNNKKKAWKALAAVKDELERDNKSVWILPEGTRSRGRGLLPFKKGAFVLSFDSGLPLIPVCFSSYHRYFNFSKKVSGHIKIAILEPLNPRQFESAEALREYCYSLMKGQIEKLDHEVQALSS